MHPKGYKKQDMKGNCKGEICNRNGCAGIIDEYEKEGCCSCHINPPCGYCTTDSSYCPVCGWSAQDEQEEIVSRNQHSITTEMRLQYEEYRRQRILSEELFYKKYRGELPAE